MEKIESADQLRQLCDVTKSFRMKRNPLMDRFPRRYHSLIDIPTGRIILITPFVMTVNTLMSNELNTGQHYWINSSPKNLFSDSFNNLRSWEWKITNVKNTPQLQHSTEDLNFDDIYRFNLIAEKAAALDFIYHQIEAYRNKFTKDIVFQNEIYQYKVAEAREILGVPQSEEITDAGIRWPFLSSWSELEGIDLHAAAQAVAVQEEIFKTRMADTESLRLKFTGKLVRLKDIKDISPLMNEFLKEGQYYGYF